MSIIYFLLLLYIFIAGYSFGVWYAENKDVAMGALIVVLVMNLFWLPFIVLGLTLIGLGYIVESVGRGGG